MPNITIENLKVAPGAGPRVPTYVDAYPLTDFLLVDGVTALSAQSPYNGGAYFKRMSLTPASPYYTADDFTLPSTTDSPDNPNGARWGLFVKDALGRLMFPVAGLASFALDHTDVTQDAEDIVEYNAGSLPTLTPHDVHITGDADVDGNLTVGGVISGDLGGGSNLPGTPDGPQYESLQSDAAGWIKYQADNGGIGDFRVYRGDPGETVFRFDATGKAEFKKGVTFEDDVTIEVLPPNLRRGAVHFYVAPPYDGTGGPGTVVMPDGTYVDTTGTHTQGLQEAIDAANPALPGDGYDLIVHGGQLGTNGPDGGAGQGYIIKIDDGFGIVFPPMEMRNITFGAVTIYRDNSSISSVDLWTWDSCQMCHIRGYGTQVYGTGRGNGMVFKPTSPLPHDAFIGWSDNTFEWSTVVYDTNGSTALDSSVVLLDPTNGLFSGNYFYINEVNGIEGFSPNGTGGNNGFKIVDAPNNTDKIFHNNIIILPELHLCRDYHFRMGTSNGQYNRGNTVTFNISSAAGNTSTVGFQDNGKKNAYHGSILMAEPTAYGVRFEAPVENNAYYFRLLQGNSYYGGSTVGSNRWPCDCGFTQAAETLSGSPWTSRPTVSPITWTVTGGTVSAIETRPTTGGSWLNTGQTSGRFKLEVGEEIRVTYSVAPTITAVKCNRTIG